MFLFSSELKRTNKTTSDITDLYTRFVWMDRYKYTERLVSIDRQTYRQTDKQTDRQKDWQTDKHTDKQTVRHACLHACTPKCSTIMLRSEGNSRYLGVLAPCSALSTLHLHWSVSLLTWKPRVSHSHQVTWYCIIHIVLWTVCFWINSLYLL